MRFKAWGMKPLLKVLLKKSSLQLSISNGMSRFIFSVLLVGSVFNSISCSNYLGGKEKEKEVIAVSDPKLDCLKQVPENIKKYLINDLSSEQTRSTINCVQEAANLFNRRTKGSGGDSYKTDELRAFFQEYFLKENTASPELAKELMKLKKALVGGSDEVITKTEIKKLVELLEVLKTEAVALQPSIRLITFQNTEAYNGDLAVSPQAIKKATESLRKSMAKLTQAVSFKDSSYGFEDVKYLLTLFSDYISGGKQVKQFNGVKRWMPLIESLRWLIVGENIQLHNEEDFLRVSDNLVEVHGLVMHIFYRVRYMKLVNATEVAELSEVIERAIFLLYNSHQFQTTHTVSFASLDAFLDQLEAYSFIPKGLSSKAIKDVFKAIVSRNFDPGRRGDLRGLHGLEKTHIMAMIFEYRAWRTKQSFIDQLPFVQNSVIAVSELKKQIESLDIKKWIAKFGVKETTEVAYLIESWQEYRHIYLRERPVLFDDKSRSLISFSVSHQTQTWMNLTQANLMLFMTRGLLNGYSENTSLKPREKYLTGKGMNQWYDEFNQFGIELKAFDPRSKESGSRSAMEANLFMPSSDGDDKMSFDETYEYLSMLISGGISVVAKTQALMADEKCTLGDLDEFLNPWLNEECFKRALRKNFAEIYGNLPYLVKYISSLDETEFESFYDDLMTAARLSPKLGRVESADLRTFTMMMHYLESLAIFVDQNQNGVFESAEMDRVASRFYGVIRAVKIRNYETLSKWLFKSDDVVHRLFKFMLVKGQLPQNTGVADWYHLFRGLGPGEGQGADSKIKANRSSIVRVFRLIKEQ